MSKYSTAGSEKILPPEGLHNARAVRFLELGTQKTDYGDKFQCMISYELVDESAVFNEENGEQNHVRHRKYNRSLKPRSDMGKAVRAILGEIDEEDEIEMDDILDGPCQVNIKYDKKKKPKYANIIDVLPVNKKNGKIAKSESDLVSLYLNEDFDQEVFDALPEFLQDMIMESEEWDDLVADGYAEEPKKKGKRKDDEDEDESPRSKKGKKKSSKKDDEDDEDEDEEEDEEDEEDDEPKKKSGKGRGARDAKKRAPARKERAKKRKAK